MSRSYWIAAIALGLIGFAISGQAQEVVQDQQERAQSQQAPAQALPIPFPVDIVEGETEAAARKLREAESRQRAIDDLAAQQGMNAATQRMADYSFWSTVFVGIGTILLVGTLLLTLQANKAARAAVKVTRDIGNHQLRAYLGVLDASITPLRSGTHPLRAKITIKNFGQTPAHNVTHLHAVNVRPFPNSEDFELVSSGPQSRSVLEPGAVVESVLVGESLTIDEEDAVRDGRMAIYAYGEIEFVDAFGAKRISKYRLMQGGDVGIRNGLLSTCGEGNEST
mgnify:CR=1 FL=1